MYSSIHVARQVLRKSTSLFSLALVLAVTSGLALAEDLKGPTITLRGGSLGSGGSSLLQSSSPTGGVNAEGAATGQPLPVWFSEAASGRRLVAGFSAATAVSDFLRDDEDGDGIPTLRDNCPTVSNPGQEDTGGIGAGSGPDGIGNDCQCGDVTGNGFVSTTDALVIRRALLVPPTAEMSRPDLCDVGSGLGCSTVDSLILRRALLQPATATIQQQCEL